MTISPGIKTPWMILFGHFKALIDHIISSGFNQSDDIENTGPLWYCTFPLFAAFLLGSRKGSIATDLLFLIALLSFLVEGLIPGTMPYGRDFQFRFLSTFLVVSLYAFLSESMRVGDKG
jgi:hypothetical protein